MSAQKVATPDSGKKSPSLLSGLLDFVISVLLLVAAGSGGYYWGLHQRMVPVKEVAAGTPGAVAPENITEVPSRALLPWQGKKKEESTSPAQPAQPTRQASNSSPPEVKQTGTVKYWLTSNGADHIGFYITASVNGTQLDNFFGPGKTLDVTRYVKDGENEVSFDAKFQGDEYNNHKGDAKSVLTVQLVKGPQIQEGFKKSDVVLSYQINAAEEVDHQDTKHFVKE